MIGERSRFSEKVQKSLAEIEDRTAEGKTITLILALNYSSRSEITRAVRRIAEKVADGQIAPDRIQEETVAENLDTAPYPDPDLIIRTSGEQRLSNFLLWQASYAELWFPEVSGPISLKGSSTAPSKSTPTGTGVSASSKVNEVICFDKRA